MKNFLKKKQNGITLIALVITIIVLLILTGVSIAMLTGENGILTQAQTSKERTEIAEIKERAQTDILGVKAGNEGKISEEQLNTILAKYGTISGEGEEKILTTTQGYVIKVLDIYNGTLTGGGSQGKTIAELYTGINNPEEEGYDENAMHIGDWVDYTAGTWEETVATPTANFAFGGYNDEQSRDENANGTYTGARAGATYEGWRIWDVSDDKQTITLISAGCPEEYYHPSGTNYAYISEYILSGNVNANADATSLGLGTTYIPRDWSIYKNETQYANNARALTKGDLDTWYAKYIDDQYTNSYDIPSFPANTANKLISTVENQCYYWLSSARSSNLVYYVYPGGRSVYDSSSRAFGVRVLVSLTSEVKFEETPEELEKDGFTYNKWIIK